MGRGKKEREGTGRYIGKKGGGWGRGGNKGEGGREKDGEEEEGRGRGVQEEPLEGLVSDFRRRAWQL